MEKKNFNLKKIFKKYKLPIIIGTVAIIVLIALLVVFLVLKKDDKTNDNDTNNQEAINYEEGTEDYFMDDVKEPEETPNTGNDYYDYINMPLSKIDFKELKKKNSQTVAFLKVNNTNVNYPVVKASNND